jgi:hypothetical protein
MFAVDDDGETISDNSEDVLQSNSLVKKKDLIRIRPWMFILVIFLIGVFLSYGIHFPDPYYYSGQYGLRKTLKTVHEIFKFLIPITSLLIIFSLIVGWLNKIKFVLIFFGLSVSLLTLITIFSIFYRIYKPRNLNFHPYLQISPPKISLEIKEKNNIFFLGGSTTAWSNSKGITWTEMIESDLKKKGFNNWKIHNQGRAWYNSLHSLINYQVNLSIKKPKYIVIMHAINDLLHNADFSYLSTGVFREDYGHFLGPTSMLVNQKLLTQDIFSIINSAFYHTPREIVDQNEFPGLKYFGNNLNQLIRSAHMDGVKVILMTEPNVLNANINSKDKEKLLMTNYEAVGATKRWSIKTSYIGMNKYNDLIREISINADGLIDLDKEIPKTFEFFRDEVHYTDKTFPIITKVVSSYLSKILN